MGLVTLQSVAIYDSVGAYYPISGSTWEVGASVGTALNFTAERGFAVFVEPGYTLRNVASFDWGDRTARSSRRGSALAPLTGWEIARGSSSGASPGGR